MWLATLSTLCRRVFAHFIYCVGEFGVVYRAKLLRKQGRSDPGFVAVKTMRGIFSKPCTFELETTNDVS